MFKTLILGTALLVGAGSGYGYEHHIAQTKIQELQGHLDQIKTLEVARDSSNAKQVAAIRAALDALKQCGVQ